LGELLTTPRRRNVGCYETACTDPLVQNKQWKRNTSLGMWKARSLYRLKSRKAVARELARYRLGLVGVRGVKWDKGEQGTVHRPVSNRFFLHQ